MEYTKSSCIKRAIKPTARKPSRAGSPTCERGIASKRVDHISSYLLERIAQTLRVPAADLDEFAQLGDLGVDSLTSVEIQLWVRSDLEVELTIEHLFTSPSIRDLAILVDQFIEGKSNGSEQGEKDVSVKNGRWVICQQPRPEAKLRFSVFHMLVVVHLHLNRGTNFSLMISSFVFSNAWTRGKTWREINNRYVPAC